MQRIQTHRINETTYQLLIVSVVLSRVSLTVRDLRYKIRNWIRINLPTMQTCSSLLGSSPCQVESKSLKIRL